MQLDNIPQFQQALVLDYCQEKLLLNFLPFATGISSSSLYSKEQGSGFATVAAVRNETWRYRHHRLYQTVATPRQRAHPWTVRYRQTATPQP